MIKFKDVENNEYEIYENEIVGFFTKDLGDYGVERYLRTKNFWNIQISIKTKKDIIHTLNITEKLKALVN